MAILCLRQGLTVPELTTPAAVANTVRTVLVDRQTDIPIVGPPSLDDMVVPSSAARERERTVSTQWSSVARERENS